MEIFNANNLHKKNYLLKCSLTFFYARICHDKYHLHLIKFNKEFLRYIQIIAINFIAAKCVKICFKLQFFIFI